MASLAGQTAFYYLAAASIATAILAVTRRNPIHSMLWVLALFLHVAGIFLLVGAEFLAAVQVIVYAGAILVFYLFFIMLLDMPQEVAGPRFGAHWPLCAAAGLAFAGFALYAGGSGLALASPSSTDAQSSTGTLSAIGSALFTRFALPFEIASLILLAAIVGAVVVAKRKTLS
ncbi:MAG TPA: NADH-quinone oxidoreductase subunit J [Vicinamibacterales bacterium]|jgi:NADH-quinone oxidoreductase subunit J|nr:NADH-quinone oxidoreductase subunit J [Vicinamibacterales bacterium]